MSLGKGGAPSAPDPYATAAAQLGLNQGTINQLALANHVNQSNPFQSSQWSQNPDGSYNQNTTYDPTVQAGMQAGNDNSLRQNNLINNALASMGAQGANAPGQAFNPEGIPNITGWTGPDAMNAAGRAQTSFNQGPSLQTGFNQGPGVQTGFNTGAPLQTSFGNAGSTQQDVAGAGDAARTAAENAAYGRSTSRLDPQWAQQQQALQTQLTNQGVTQNSDAWNKAMDDFSRQRNDAYSTARQDSVGQGLNEQQAQYGMNLSSGQFHNAAQDQTFQQLMNRAGFTNQALGQQFGQNQAAAQFGNQAANQIYNQNQGAATFNNNAAGQQFGQNLAAANFGNQGQNQNFQQLLAQAGFGNTTRQNQVQEALMARNQPLQELNALRNGSNPTLPGLGQNAQIGNQGAPNFGGYQQTAYQGQLNNYNTQVGSSNSLLGSLLGLGGMFALGG